MSINFRTRDVGLDCCFQTALIPVPRCREGGWGLGSIRFLRMGGRGGGGMASGGLALCHTQRSSTCWDPYVSLPVPGRNRNAQLSLQQQLDRWYCLGHIHVVKSRPRGPHTWRYAPSPCRSLPWIQCTCTGRPKKVRMGLTVNWYLDKKNNS